MNKKAWEILSTDEKTALSLQLGLSKSSWESGEIMQKSHYKYLEIKYRAEHFLKLFTEHIELFDEMIPEYITGNKTVLAYFRLCLEKRMKPMEAILELGKTERVTKNTLNEKIVAQMAEWEKSNGAYELTVFNLIKEFDRWNNFRILPKEIQEPSAYKRRIKNFYKKQLKVITTLNTLSLDKIAKLYKLKRSQTFLPVMYDGQPQVWPIKLNSNSVKILSDLGLYIFDSLQPAQEYINNIDAYIGKGKKACTDGLDFWPKHRELIKKAANYEDVQKITPSRRYLQMALSKLEYL